LGFIGAYSGFFYQDLNIYDVLMDSIKEKTSASKEPLCQEEKAEFLITQITLIAINFSPLDQYSFSFKSIFHSRHLS
jgi:hypothetical protein